MNETRFHWQENAGCRGVEPEIFFPVSDEEAGPAKAICDACTVRVDCLAFSFENRERYGVWGGLSEKERVDLVRRGQAQRVLAGAVRAAG